MLAKMMEAVLPSKRGIGMVFQSYAIYPHLNVENNMALALKRRLAQGGDRAAHRRGGVNAGAGRPADPAPSQLSGGQRQRVAIGRAIVRQPKLFLFH